MRRVLYLFALAVALGSAVEAQCCGTSGGLGTWGGGKETIVGGHPSESHATRGHVLEAVASAVTSTLFDRVVADTLSGAIPIKSAQSELKKRMR